MPASPLRLGSAFLCSALAALAIPLTAYASAQESKPAALQPRITAPIDESSLTTLRGNTHPLAQAKFDQGPAPASAPAARLLLVLSRSTQQEAELQTYLQSLQDTSSPNFHKFLTPAEFGARFGVADADLQTIRAWLTGHGLTVNKISAGRMSLEFSGTAAQVEAAFHTALHRYVINGQQHYANATDPQIPTALAPVVAGVTALNDFRPRALAVRGPSGAYNLKDHTVTPTYTTGSAANGYYIFVVPADAATIYDTPTALNPNLSGTAYDGTGVTIGVVGDSNIDVTQNANYRATFGLSAKATTVVVDGNDPGENGDAVEAYLDTEISGGIAPNASVILYASADTGYQAGVYLAMLRAVDDNLADILNVSFVECEAGFGAAGNQFVNQLWEQAAAQGISVTVAAGDSGSAGCDDFDSEKVANQGLAVNGLSSTPFNISVGGTDFDVLYSNFPTSFSQYVNLDNTLPNHRSALGYIPEEPWNDSTIANGPLSENQTISSVTGNAQDNDIVAGSGGISSVYAVPSWQTAFATGQGRNLPDVAFLAGNGFYGAVWATCTDQDSAGPDCAPGAQGNSFNITGVGGTSAASPAFAGILALVAQKTGSRLGQADAVLYDLARNHYSAVFHDITTGNNSVDCQSGSSGCSQDTAGYYFMTGYNATTGYDTASGLGSADATMLVNDWASADLAASTSALQLNGSTAALSITHGQSVNVAATVSSTGGTPTGDVALVDSLSPATRPNSEGLANFILANGSAAGTTTYLPGGSYQVSAHYGGSGTIAQSDSNSIPVTVAAESSSTTISVSAYDPETGKLSTTPSYGFIFLIDAQPYGNSASVANPNGAATGAITFNNNTTVLGTAPLSSEGIAELQTTTIPAGSNSLTAVFAGDASFQASTSSAFPITIPKALSYLNQPGSTYGAAPAGTPITFWATFNNTSLGAPPTGSIAFQSDSKTIGTGPIEQIAGSEYRGGTATLITSLLPSGTHTITASYPGDSNYAASAVSESISVTIQPASVNLAIVPSVTSIASNQPLQVTTTGVPISPLPAPTGAVTLTTTGYTSAATTLVNGTATITIPANTLQTGPDTLTVTFPGDMYYASGSNSVAITVTPTGTMTPTLTLTPSSIPYRTLPGTLTVAVSGSAGNPTPTGRVLFGFAGGNQLSSQTLVNGSTTFTFPSASLSYGPNLLTANYEGDSNYATGTANITVVYAATPAVTVIPASPTIVVDQPLNVGVGLNWTYLPAPTGTVTLTSGTYTSAPTAVSAGSGTVIAIPANSLAVGTDTLTVNYSGDADYNPSSGTASETVNPAPPPGLTLAGTALTVQPGATTANTSTITLTPANGFTGSVALTAAITTSPAGAQDPPTFSFGATTPVSITGAGAATATLTVYTTAPSSAALEAPRRPGGNWLGAGGAAFACVLLFGIRQQRRALRNALGMLALFVALACGALACGGSGGGGGGGTPIPGTTPGVYVVTVTGTSGALTSTCTVNVTVQ